MRFISLTLATLIGAATITGAMADGKDYRDHGKRGHAEYGRKFCPPGLAKKNNGCTPPGHAKYHYSRGDHFHHDDDRYYIRYPDRYRLPRLGRNEAYYRVGDTFIRINRDTKEVLDLITAVGRVLN